MTMTIVSTTDSPEAVAAAMGDLAQAKPGAEQAAEAKETVEAKSEESGESTAETASTDEATDETEASNESEESTEELEAKEDGTEKPKKKGGWQRKLERKDREIEYWREAALKAQQSKGPAKEPETTTQAKSQDAPGKPKAEDFENHADYVEALTDWKLEQKLSAKDREVKESQAKNEQQTKFQKHQEKLSKFIESEGLEDFDDVVSVYNTKGSMTLQESILDSDIGPKLMYELAKDQKELDRILSLSPIAQAREIGKIEARLTKPQSSTEKKTTQAPAPVNPVRAKGGTTVKKDIYDPNLSFKEYERLRNEQEKARRAQR